MRTGTVLYLTDAASVPDDVDDEAVISRAGLDPGWTLVAAQRCGYYAVEEALHLLISRGATRVDAVKGRLGPDGFVDLFGAPLRLHG